jgi:hypothetical protein
MVYGTYNYSPWVYVHMTLDHDIPDTLTLTQAQQPRTNQQPNIMLPFTYIMIMNFISIGQHLISTTV